MTEQVQPEQPAVASIEHLVAHFEAIPAEVRAELTAALMEREDNIAHYLRVMGEQYHVLQPVMAKVFMDAGFGTPPDDMAHEFINAQYQAVMNEIARQFPGIEFGPPA